MNQVICSKERELGIMATEITIMKDDIKDMKIGMDKGFNDMKECFEALDKKYASKLTERIVYGLLAVITVALITALITKAVGAW